jgi:hypothetical protein
MRWVLSNPVRLRPLWLTSALAVSVPPTRHSPLHHRARGPPSRAGCRRGVCLEASASVYFFVFVPQVSKGDQP